MAPPSLWSLRVESGSGLAQGSKACDVAIRQLASSVEGLRLPVGACFLLFVQMTVESY